MRDYLAIRPKRELEHADSSPAKTHEAELIENFGPRILNLTAEEYFLSLPPAKREDALSRLTEVLLRQVDSALEHAAASSPTDYLAFHKVEPGDAEQHGVLGMRWGRRRSDAAIAADHAQRAASGEKVTPTAKHDGPESPQQRYSRLAAVAKGGGSKTLDDDDLKFFNARTEAIKKVDKMFEEKPSWARTTTNDVVRAVAKQQMQAVLSTIATKYIAAPIGESVTKAQADKNNEAIKAGIKKGLEEAAKRANATPATPKVKLGFTAPVKK